MARIRRVYFQSALCEVWLLFSPTTQKQAHKILFCYTNAFYLLTAVVLDRLPTANAIQPTQCSLPLSPPRDKHLKPILQTLHIRVRILLHLKTPRNDLDTPRDDIHRRRRFEAQIEEAGVLSIDAEGVHGAAWVGFDVSVEPLFYSHCISIAFKEGEMGKCDLPASFFDPLWNLSSLVNSSTFFAILLMCN